MEISKKPWPILSVCGFKSRIDTNPDFQRPAVWSIGQKQLLIDTILRGYDIPKLPPTEEQLADAALRVPSNGRFLVELKAALTSMRPTACLVDGA